MKDAKKRKRFLCYFIILALGSCNSTSEKTIDVLDEPLISGLADPVQLELELTRIPMSNYVEDPTRIDSVTSDGPFNYEIDNSDIILIGRPQKQLYVLHLWSNGFKESILLKRTKPILHSFLYIGDAKEVKVKGDFNEWDEELLKLKKSDKSFTDYVLLRPGEYEYLFVVDDKEILDPYNKDSVQNDGEWRSVLTVPGTDVRKSPTIDLIGNNDRKIQLTAQKISNVYVFWQNTLLTSDFISNTENGFIITIPNNATELDNSTIRIWAENEESFSEALEIELQSGKVILEER